MLQSASTSSLLPGRGVQRRVAADVKTMKGAGGGFGGVRSSGFQYVEIEATGADSPNTTISNSDRNEKFVDNAHPRDVFSEISGDRSGDFAGRRGTYFGTHSHTEAKKRRSIIKKQVSGGVDKFVPRRNVVSGYVTWIYLSGLL